VSQRRAKLFGGVDVAAPNLRPRLKVSDLRCINWFRLSDLPAGANRIQGLVEEPDNLILRHLRDLRTDIAEVKAELKADMNSFRADMRSEMNSLRADVASDFVNVNREIAALRKETREQIVGVRRALTEYHSAVVGTGF